MIFDQISQDFKLWCSKRNSKISKGQTEIVKSEDRQEYGQQNEMKDKPRTHNTTLKTKAGVTRKLQGIKGKKCKNSNYFTSITKCSTYRNFSF